MSMSRVSFASEGKLDRRSVVLGGVALAACATTPSTPDPTADADFRALIDQLGGDTISAPERASALAAVQRAGLSPSNRILLDAVVSGAQAEAALSHFAYADGPFYTVTTRSGAYRAPAPEAHALDGDTAKLEANAVQGVIAPDFILDRTIAAVTQARSHAVTPTAPPDLDAAFARQLATLQRLRAQATPDAGVWRLPHGEDLYARQLSFNLGATTDPRLAHERAAWQCRAWQAEADTLLRAEGGREADVGARLRALMENPRFLYPDSDAGKTAAVAYMNMRLLRAREYMPRAFAAGLETTPAIVRRMSAEDEARGAAGRRDGQSYIVDLTHIRNRPSWTLPSVVHHELAPGHLLQASLGDAAQAPRLQVRYATGYNEGWAIYAERLMDELGAFEDDKLARIGYLQWMLFRIGRVVADTGIHVMRWSRERAIAEMRALQGDSIAFISIEDDVERFCLQPGFYAAQGLAALNIHDLRERVKSRVGARFTLQHFHDAMLRSGPLSPPGLAEAANVRFSS